MPSSSPAPLDAVLGKLRTPQGQKMLRYSMASVVSVMVSLVCLVFFDGVLSLGAVVSSTLATAVATVPSYWLNRKWAWGKHGKSHLVKEVIPFWALAFTGWAFSTYSVRLVEIYAKHHHWAHLDRTIGVAVVYVGAFGVLWVGKFVIFNRILFVHHHHAEAATLGGGTGVRS
jgi:putative flippase GtrA